MKKVYVIRASYMGGRWEYIDVTLTKEEASRLADEYQSAYGDDWTMKVVSRKVVE